MTIAEIGDALERSAAAETKRRVHHANAEYKAEAVDDWHGLECSEAMDSCDREACRKMLGRPV